MGSSILNIGASALNAAQVGVATTGHNIANASSPGYTRQVVNQSAVAGGDAGFAFIGKGTEVTSVTRVYNEFLAAQVLSAQTSESQLTTYSSQLKRIDSVLADQNAGVSPALQDFFGSLQSLSADPNSSASRQALLSSSESLAARFQGLAGQLNDARQTVNGQLSASVSNVNVYASQIANLNDAIEKAQAGGSKTANDLLDQRDQAVSNLSKEIKVSVVKQGDSYNVFIGSGQPLVVGTKVTTLIVSNSATDASRAEISAKTSAGIVTQLEESSLNGGTIGGLFEFRANSLDAAQNTLGRVATNLAATFNAQHALGQTQTGAAGGAFFNVGVPEITPSTSNISTGAGVVSASISNASALTVSDYKLQAVSSAVPATATPTSYKLTRLSDGAVTSVPVAASSAAGTSFTVDGVDFTVANTAVTNDEFAIRPVRNGAAAFSVAISNTADIALGAAVISSAASINKGTGAISAPVVNATTLLPAGLSLNYNGTNLSNIPAGTAVTVNAVSYPAGTTSVPYSGGDTITFGGVTAVFGSAGVLASGAVAVPSPKTTLTYNAAAGGTLSGFPATLGVSVTVGSGTPVNYAPGATVPYTAGAKVSFGGISVTLSGTPSDGDTFTTAANLNGQGDNRNAVLLSKLQTTNTLDNGTTTYQGAYSQLVSIVGNKAHELQATSSAASSLLAQSVASQQSESGVNLDEEAANLLRYQQAYQAAGKLIQTASTLFSVLLSLGSA